MGFGGAGVVVGAGVVLSAEKNSHDYYVQHGGAETRTMMGGGVRIFIYWCSARRISIEIDPS